jgi:carbonic anhydrase/acetyltransferase-like protein (isoleucine patch superfamily)
MDGAVVQRGAMVAAGALVTRASRVPSPPSLGCLILTRARARAGLAAGVTVPTGQIFAGNPAKLLRAMTAEESAFINKSAENYAQLAASHAAECAKSFEQLQQAQDTHVAEMLRDADYDSHRGIAPPGAAVSA